MLCCGKSFFLANSRKSKISQNKLLLNEYEEEIKKLHLIIMKKDEELNNLIKNLLEVKKKLNIFKSKDIKIKREDHKKKLDSDALELTLGWNDIIIPIPVREVSIESVQESISIPKPILQIQKLNTIMVKSFMISKKKKKKIQKKEMKKKIIQLWK